MPITILKAWLTTEAKQAFFEKKNLIVIGRCFSEANRGFLLPGQSETQRKQRLTSESKRWRKIKRVKGIKNWSGTQTLVTSYLCKYIFATYLKTTSMGTWAESHVLFFLLALSLSLVSASDGSHSLQVLLTYIKEETEHPVFNAIFVLDDITVGYYNSETKIYVARGNTTNEDDVVDPNHLSTISDYVSAHFMRRSNHLRPINNTESHVVYQVMNLCEQRDNKPTQIIMKAAFRGSTTDELRFLDGKFTYQNSLNYTAQEIKPYLELAMWRLETVYYPACIETLQSYLKKRGTQVKRKVKPRVRLIQKANSDSGGSHVSCLATGFYPRHINLTLFRDGQPVSDHEITGGDLLPNGDGTYQMRKSLEISADKHKYTCSATHLSLDNKLDVTLEYDHGEPFKSVIPSVLMVLLALMIVFGAAAIIWKRRRADSLKNGYSSPSTFEESVETK